MDPKTEKIIKKGMLVLSIVLSVTGQIAQQSLADDSLPTSLISNKVINPDRSDGGKKLIGRTLYPGAIGDGQAFLDFVDGKLPTEIKNVKALTIQSITAALELAIKLHISNRGKLSSEHRERSEKILENLISLHLDCKKKLYLFKTDVSGRKNYLLGFNRNGLIGLDLKLVKTLASISSKRLAQYIYHENVPEHIKIEPQTKEIDREDHRVVYKEIQPVIFGKDEVESFAWDLRRHINNTEACLSRIERKRFGLDKEKDLVKRFVITIFEPDNKIGGIRSSDNNEFMPLAIRKDSTKNLFRRTRQNCGGVWLSYELNKERFQLQKAPPIIELLQTFIDYNVIKENNYRDVIVFFFEELIEMVKDLTVLEEDEAYFMIANLVKAWLIRDTNYDKILDLVGKINLEAGMFKRETFKNLKELASIIGTNAQGRHYFSNILKHIDVDYLISLIETPGEDDYAPERAWIVFDFIHALFSIKGITEGNIDRIKESTVGLMNREEKDYVETVRAYKAFSEYIDEKKACDLSLEDDTNKFIKWLNDSSLPPMAYMDIMRTIHDDHVPPEPVSIRRDESKMDDWTREQKVKADLPKREKDPFISGRVEIEFRAEIFKYSLMQLLQKNPGKIFAIAVDSNIGETQKSSIMPISTAVDQIKKMMDTGGHSLFPNLRVIRAEGKSGKLMVELNGLIESGTLDKERIFLVARKENVDSGKFKSLEGSSWIAAIDDLSNGDATYLPVFEALSLIMLSAQVTEIDSITKFYNKISDKTEKELQEMIKDKLICVLPKALHIPPQQLRESYENVKNIYLAA